VRVKRTNQTIFLHTEPTDTIGDVKEKLSTIIKVGVDGIRLIVNVPLEDARSLLDLKIENDSVLFMVFKKEGTNEYEEVNLQKPAATDNSESKSESKEDKDEAEKAH